MITYSKSSLGLGILCRLTGTAWPSGLIPGTISAVVSFVLGAWDLVDDEIRDRPEFISHPYAFQLFAYLLGFIVVFRTNHAYQRYWEAVGALQAMAAKWLDGALMAIAFDAGGDNETPLLWGADDKCSRTTFAENGHRGGGNHSDFYSEVVHLTSLLHAVALQHLRADPNLDNLQSAYAEVGSVTGSTISVAAKMVRFGLPSFREPEIRDTIAQQKLPVLGGISDGERACLEYDGQGHPVATDARVAMVEGWLMRRLIARQKFEQGQSQYTSPPILSRMYQVISDGTLWFGAASKIAVTPFPFPYRNLLSIFLWIYTVLAPFLINGIIMNVPLRIILSFTVVFAYHALNNIGDNLEDPYLPYDPNELPLPSLQHSVNMRLYAFGRVPTDRGTSRMYHDISSPDRTPCQKVADVLEKISMNEASLEERHSSL